MAVGPKIAEGYGGPPAQPLALHFPPSPYHLVPKKFPPLRPQINTTPSKQAKVAAASDELRLECCIISRAGRDHVRKGQVSEVRGGGRAGTVPGRGRASRSLWLAGGPL